MNQLLNIIIIGILTALFYLKFVPISRFLAGTRSVPSGLEQFMIRPWQIAHPPAMHEEQRLPELCEQNQSQFDEEQSYLTPRGEEDVTTPPAEQGGEQGLRPISLYSKGTTSNPRSIQRPLWLQLQEVFPQPHSRTSSPPNSTPLVLNGEESRHLTTRGEGIKATVQKVRRLMVPEVRLLAMHQIRERNRSQRFLPRDLVVMIGGFYHDEIQSLFNIFTSDKDRNLIIGFSSYEEMNEVLPSKEEKVQYLKALRTDGYGSDEDRKSTRRPIFVFNDHGTVIQKMHLYGHGERDHRNGVPAFPPPINWRAFSGLMGLKELDLSVYVFHNRHSRDKLSISMEDLSHLPSSLKKLFIGGNRWMDQDFNLEKLPPGLMVVDAAECEGMDKIWNLSARKHSELHYLKSWYKSRYGVAPPNELKIHDPLPQYSVWYYQ